MAVLLMAIASVLVLAIVPVPALLRVTVGALPLVLLLRTLLLPLRTALNPTL